MIRLSAILLCFSLSACSSVNGDAWPFDATPVATFDAPWAMTFLPDGRLLVTEKAGSLFVVSQNGEKSAPVTGVPAVAAGGQKVVGQISVKTRPLHSVLDEFMPKGQSIDFLSVDVEGFDLEVLRSNDWTRHRPAVVVVECMDMYQHECFVGIPVYSFLVSQGYTLWACTGGNFVFIDP